SCLFGLLVVLAGAAPCARADDLEVLNDDAHFAEGPVWYRGKLYYVEYDRNSVTTWDGARNAVFWSKPGCGPSAVIPTARGEFLTTCYDSGSIGRISADGKELPPYTHDKDGKRFVGPNDFAPDRHGGIYFTCSGTAPGPVIDGKIFYIAPDDTISQKATDIHAPLAGTIFVVDDTGKLLRTLRLPSPGVPNLALSPDEKTVYVMALDQLDKPPYHGKVYAIANR